MHKGKTRTVATNALFGAFILAAQGTGLFLAWAMQARAGVLIHLLVAVPGLAICALVLVRRARHWPARLAPLHRANRHGRLPIEPGTALGCGMPFLAGIAMACVFASGSASLLVLAALGLGILPWTRILVCRNHFFLAAALLGLGSVLALNLLERPVAPPHYALSALLCLCMAGLMTVFVIMAHGSRRHRMAAGYGWLSD